VKKLFLLTILLEFANVFYAQILQSSQFVQGSIKDGEKLMQAYLWPVEKSFNSLHASDAFQLFEGKHSWRISVNVMAAVVPKRDRTYDVNKLQLENFEPANPAQHIAQTFGGTKDSILLQTKDKYKVPSFSWPFYQEKPVATFYTPTGVTSVVPFASLGLTHEGKSLILSGNTLFIPSFVLGGKAMLFAGGLQAQLKIYKGLSVLSSFHGTFLHAYPHIYPKNGDSSEYKNQLFYIHSFAIPVGMAYQFALSEHLAFYVAGGRNFAWTETGLLGTYPVYKSDPTNTYNVVFDKIKDPIRYYRDNSDFFLMIGSGYNFNRFGFALNAYLGSYQSMHLRISYFLGEEKKN
jgi:hypothetical protein